MGRKPTRKKPAKAKKTAAQVVVASPAPPPALPPKTRKRPEQGKARFLAAYQQTGNVVHAARIAQIDRAQHYRWLDADPEYARSFDESKQQAADILESEAIRRAVEGTRELVLVGGKPVRDPRNGEYLFKSRYSDVLLIFLLKGLLPEKYRDQHVPTGEDDGVRIAGRERAEVIREEIAARQKALEMLTGGVAANGRN